MIEREWLSLRRKYGGEKKRNRGWDFISRRGAESAESIRESKD